jgi:TP901 family phage tail tape measure protein
MSENTFTVNIDWTNAQSSMKNLVESLDRLNRKLDEFGTKGKQVGGKTAAGTKMAAEEMKKLNARYRELSREFDRVMSKSKKVDQGTERWKRYLQRVREINRELNVLRSKGATGVDAVTQAQGKLNNQVSLGRQLFLRLRSVMLTVFGAYAIINGIRNTINTVKEFELGMARLQAITGETKEAMDALGDINKVLAADGIFSATEIAGIQVQLAKFGFTLKEITASTGGILDLATATGEDLNSAVDLVSSSIRALGMEASETGRLVDVLGKAFTSSALDVGKFRESAKYVLPLARQMGWSIEEVAATLGKLADSGISGSLAGTGLRQTFIQLWDASSDLSQVLGAGIKTFDDFYDAITDAKRAGVAFDEVLAAVPVRAKTMFTVLWNGARDIQRYREEIEASNGAIKEMAEVQLNTLAYEIKRTNSAWKSFVLSMQDSGGALKEIFGFMADGLRGLTRFLNPHAYGMMEASKAVEAYKKSLDATGRSESYSAVKSRIGLLTEELEKQEDVLERMESRGAVPRTWDVGLLPVPIPGSGVFNQKELNEQISIVTKLKEELRLLGDLEFDLRVGADVERNIEKTLKDINSLDGWDELKEKYDVKDFNEFLSKATLSSQEKTKLLDEFRISYEGVLEEISLKAQDAFLSGEQDNLDYLGAIFSNYKEWGERTIALVSGDVVTLMELEREATANKLKALQGLYDQQRKLELIRNENRVQSEEEREKNILSINKKYDGLGYQALLKYGELTKTEKEIINALLLELDKTYARESLKVTDEFYEQWIDKITKRFNDLMAIEKAKGEIEIQEMKNNNATKEEVWRRSLELEISFAEQQLEFAKRVGASADEVERLTLELERLSLELEGGFTGKDTDPDTSGIERYINDIVRLSNIAINAWKKMVDEQVRATEAIVGDLNTRIAEVQRDLEREQELYIEGYANNVTVKQKEYQDLKAIRERALKDRDAAVRRQQRIEAISQAVNITSAVSNVINQYSKIPWVGWALGVAAAAAFIGLFESSKSKINALTKYGEGGEIRGKSHTMGGVPIEAEGGEFVVRKKQYTKYKELVNAINRDDLPEINRHVVNNTNFGRSEKIVVSTKEWREIRDLLRDNLDREDERVLGAKKIISKGIKKRIVDV